MKIRELMEAKVLTIDCDASVRELEEILTARQISGAPVVSRGGRLMGVVSRTDATRFRAICKREQRLGRAPHNPETARVWEIYTPDVVTIGPDAEAKDGARKMLDQQVHRLIVVDHTGIVGIVSSFDFLRLLD